MRRERSTTIYANSENEYKKIMEENDLELEKKTTKKRSRLSSIIEEMENSPDSKKFSNFNDDNFENFHLELLNLDLYSEEINKNKYFDDGMYFTIDDNQLLNINENCLNYDKIVKDEEYGMLKQNYKFEFDFIQPSFFEMEKIKEEKLISDIKFLNKSFKLKNTENFLNALNEIYLDNYTGISNTLGSNEPSLLNSPNKSRRCFSYDRLDTAEIDLNYNTFKKPASFQSGSFTNKIESQSTNFMSENTSKNYYIDSDSSGLPTELEFEKQTTPFSITNKINPIVSSIPKSNLENIISQNLVISDEVVKIIVIGDKRVGKSLFINNFCENKSISKNYEPTQSLEINKKYFNHIGKYIKIELWDTNISILNSNIIETYYKISNGFIFICDINEFESISYIEKQLAKISGISNNCSNIFLIANNFESKINKGKNQNQENIYSNNPNYLYLSQICEKNNLKVNLINLIDANNLNQIMEKFISGCLIRKKNSIHKSKRSSIKNNSNKENININQYNKSQGSADRDLSHSLRKAKKDNCIIF